MTDEQIIRRRLLIDGDGTGDDRRLNILLKTFIKWCNTKDNLDSQIIYNRLLAQLAQCSFVASKSKSTIDTIDKELKNYEALSVNIEKSIGLARKELEMCKTDLKFAKKVRKNREEYDTLAKTIKSEPDRKQTAEKLEVLRSELRDLEEESMGLQRKIEKRQISFKVLLRSIKELKDLCNDSSDDESNGLNESRLMDRVDDDDDIEIELQAISPPALD